MLAYQKGIYYVLSYAKQLFTAQVPDSHIHSNSPPHCYPAVAPTSGEYPVRIVGTSYGNVSKPWWTSAFHAGDAEMRKRVNRNQAPAATPSQIQQFLRALTFQ